MSVTSACEICHTGAVEHTCSRCGQLVCDRHFDSQLGLCVECAVEVGRPSEEDRVPEDMPDGVDTYRF